MATVGRNLKSGTVVGLLLAATVAVFLALGLQQRSRPAVPQAEAGVLDLSGWDFQRDGSVELGGTWPVFWGRLLDPQAALEAEPDGELPLLGTWNGRPVGGLRLPGSGTATFRLRLRLPAVTPLRSC